MIYPKGDSYPITWEVLPLNIKGTNNLIETWGELLNRHLSKGTQMANRDIKKLSVSLIIGEYKSKAQ